MITPTTEVQIWDFNNETKPVKLIMLGAWKIALKSEVAGHQVSSQLVAPIVREFLSAPADYPIEHLSDHITTSYDDIMAQFDSGDFNYEPTK